MGSRCTYSARSHLPLSEEDTALREAAVLKGIPQVSCVKVRGVLIMGTNVGIDMAGMKYLNSRHFGHGVVFPEGQLELCREVVKFSFDALAVDVASTIPCIGSIQLAEFQVWQKNIN